MLVLVLVVDARRRRRVADACRAVSPAVECIESGDEAAAVFGVAPDRFDLVVVDSALHQRHGSAWLINWRRMAFKGDVLMLQSDPAKDQERVRRAVLRGLGGAAGRKS